jgi:hypothetical protein
MPRLHDPAFRDSVKSRIRTLTPEAKPRWGRMSADQMLWHVNSALDAALGKTPYEPHKAPMFPALLRFGVLYGPWPKGRTPTLPQFEAKARYDFEAERARCLSLIDEFTGRPLDGEWAKHPFFGTPSGEFNTRLQGRHFEHHLTQFGA